jgi:acetylornithine deacetylase/succinyl-diaminopimelate desuccinylase-like protein
MHQIDERVPESEIRQLQAVYAQLIRGYFKTFA